MRRSFQILFLLLSVFLLSNCEKKSNDILYDRKYIDEIKASRKEVGFFMARNNVPGGSVAVSKNGKIIYSEGIGMASKELEVPVTRNIKFRIGDVSELFTSFIYLRLVQEGKLHPDSSVQHYLPDFPEKNYRINLNHLVNHTSGIRTPSLYEDDWQGMNVTLQKGLDNFRDDPLVSVPDMYQEVSMYNYNLLGAVMEKATGKSFKNLLEYYVTDTLHLSNTVIDNPLRTIMGRSECFDLNIIAQVVNATSRDLTYCAPAKGMLSNAEDLVKFGNAILHSELLSEETKKSMFESVPLFNDIPSPMANGWVLLVNKQGSPFYGRSGSVTGGNAALLIYPEYDLVVAITTNLKTGINELPVFEIAQQFLPAPEVEQTEED